MLKFNLRHIFSGFIPAWIATLLLASNLAYAAPSTKPLLDLPSPPPVQAASYILIDADNGYEISSLAADESRAPASLTKMMNLYVVFQALDQKRIQLDDVVTISTEAWKQTGSKMFIEPREKLSVAELINGVIVASGNDAAYALAEFVAGDANVFIAMMNKTAERLGMTHSHFNSVNGLPSPDQYTTARDLSILARATIENFPELYKMYMLKKSPTTILSKPTVTAYYGLILALMA